MNKKLEKEWKKGWDEGTKAVLQILKEMKELDFDEEYFGWEIADEYIKLNGEVVKRYE